MTRPTPSLADYAAAEHEIGSMASLNGLQLENEKRAWEQKADWHYFPPGAEWPELDRRDHIRALAFAAVYRGEQERRRAEPKRKAA